MINYLNKIYAGLIAVLLTIIGFFLMATYNKISDTNTRVYELQIELSAMREKESHFMDYESTSQLIDRKIRQYHEEKHQ